MCGKNSDETKSEFCQYCGYDLQYGVLVRQQGFDYVKNLPQHIKVRSLIGIIVTSVKNFLFSYATITNKGIMFSIFGSYEIGLINHKRGTFKEEQKIFISYTDIMKIEQTKLLGLETVNYKFYVKNQEPIVLRFAGSANIYDRDMELNKQVIGLIEKLKL
jgi:hypothetical protein